MRFYILLAVALALIACSSTVKKPGSSATSTTTVEVNNENVLDMTIYVLRGNERFRLGVVPSGDSRVFRIPEDLVYSTSLVRFLADPLGSRSKPITEEIPVTPGERNELTIRNFQ